MPDKPNKSTLGVAANYKKHGSAGTGTTATTATDDDPGGINWRERLVSATPSGASVIDWQQKNDQSEAKAKAKVKRKAETKTKFKSIQSSATALSESSSSGSEMDSSSSEEEEFSEGDSLESGNQTKIRKRPKPKSNSLPYKIIDFLSFVFFGSRYFYFEDAEEDELKGFFKKLKHKLNKEIVSRPPGKTKWLFKKKKSRDLRLMMRMNKSRPTAVIQTVLDLANPDGGRPNPRMWKKHKTHLYNRGEGGEWANDTEFLLCALGGVVGLGNLNLSHAILTNGGVMFLLPYWIMFFAIGYPMLMMEMSIGQFTSCGVTMSWEYSKIFQGLSFAIIISVACRAMYYNIIIGWGLDYLYESFQTNLPWIDCNNDWNTYLCLKYPGNKTCDFHKLIESPDGTCVDIDGIVTSFWNITLAGESDIKTDRQSPAEQFYIHKILGKPRDITQIKITELGTMQWDNLAFYAIAWICVVLALRKGISTYAKVPYVTLMLPYICTFMLLIKGMSLEGASSGVKELFKTQEFKDKEGKQLYWYSLKVWVAAAEQIFFSLDLGTCCIMNLAKHNRFSADIPRDAFIIAFVNCMSSHIFAIMVCCYLGFITEKFGVEFDTQVKKDKDLLFIVMPAAIAQQDGGYIWSILFFTMIVTLGIDSEVMMVKVVVDAAFDICPQFNYLGLLVSISVVTFLTGSVMCLQGGNLISDLVAQSTGGIFLFTVAFLQIFSVTWVYGVQRFLNDIEYMVGDTVFGIVPWVVVRYGYAFLLRIITPLLCLLLLILGIIKYVSPDEEKWYSDNLEQLFPLGFWIVMLFLFIGCAVYFYLKKEGTCLQRVFSLAKATRYWVPLREESLQFYDTQNKYFK